MARTIRTPRQASAGQPALFSLSRTHRRTLRIRFKRRHWIRLPRFLNSSTLKILRSHFKKAKFLEYNPKGDPSLHSNRESSPRLGRILTLFLSHPALFDFVKDVAECPEPVQSLAGRVFRQTSNRRHYVRWHSDPLSSLIPGRMSGAALVINLGGAYRGGALEIQSPDRKKTIVRFANTRAGDALLFRNSLFHRGAPVVGRRPKLQYVGWFSPDQLHSNNRGEDMG